MLAVKTHQLVKEYSKKVRAVDGLSLEIRRGEVFGLLGPNGAGKSTTINMIAGLLSPTQGRLEVLGYTLPDEINKIKDRIGYVSQDIIFYPHLTVYENLDLVATCYEIPQRDERIKDLLALLQIEDLADRRSTQLSGGQKRRLNIALGMLNDPEILILDEPSAGMDPQSRKILWETVQSLAKQKEITIILTSHIMETVDRLSDRIAIIDDGKVVVIDTPQALKKIYGAEEMIRISWKNEEINIDPLIHALHENYPVESIKSQPHELTIGLSDAVNQLISIVKLVELHLGEGKIANINILENTLENVFLEITGKELRE
ncbi:MAG: ABC transporter ATP-binding protein [Candidatus Heimdallarchaeota archaeon]|nr:ABC transporter ATP-binding protein [Candidatus Heimdallarchaeota archaeon]